MNMMTINKYLTIEIEQVQENRKINIPIRTITRNSLKVLTKIKITKNNIPIAIATTIIKIKVEPNLEDKCMSRYGITYITRDYNPKSKSTHNTKIRKIN